MDRLANQAGSFQERMLSTAKGLNEIRLSPNAFGPIGAFMVPALNMSKDSSAQQAERASTTFGNVQANIKATHQTHLNTDTHSSGQFDKIIPNSNALRPPGTTGTTAGPTNTNGNSYTAPPPPKGTTGTTAGPGNTGGKQVGPVTTPKGTNGGLTKGTSAPGGSPLNPITNPKGTGGSTSGKGTTTPGGSPIGPVTNPKGTGGSTGKNTTLPGGSPVNPTANPKGTGGSTSGKGSPLTGGSPVSPVATPGGTGGSTTGKGSPLTGGSPASPVTTPKGTGGSAVGGSPNSPTAGSKSAVVTPTTPAGSPITRGPDGRSAAAPAASPLAGGAPPAGGAAPGGATATERTSKYTAGSGKNLFDSPKPTVGSTGTISTPPKTSSTVPPSAPPKTTTTPTAVPPTTPGTTPTNTGTDRTGRPTATPNRGLFEGAKPPIGNGTISTAPPNSPSTPQPAPKPTPAVSPTPAVGIPTKPGTTTTPTPGNATPATAKPAPAVDTPTTRPGTTPPLQTPANTPGTQTPNTQNQNAPKPGSTSGIPPVDPTSRPNQSPTGTGSKSAVLPESDTPSPAKTPRQNPPVRNGDTTGSLDTPVVAPAPMLPNAPMRETVRKWFGSKSTTQPNTPANPNAGTSGSRNGTINRPNPTATGATPPGTIPPGTITPGTITPAAGNTNTTPGNTNTTPGNTNTGNTNTGNNAPGNTPPNPGGSTPLLSSKNLPEFVNSGRALGAVATANPTGVPRVLSTVTTLLPRVDGATPQGIGRIEAAIDGNFETLLGNGRKFPVQVGNQHFEVKVVATLHSPPSTAVAPPASTTKVDMATNSGSTTGSTTQISTSGDIGTSALFTTTVGPYGSVGAKAQFARPAQANTTQTSTVDNRQIRSGKNSTNADVPVTYTLTVVDAQNNVVNTGTVTSTATDPVGITLKIPDEITTLTPPVTPGRIATPADGWGGKIEHPAPEAVTFDGNVTPDQAFDRVAAKLPPSVTQMGAPGRTELRDFLSATNIRDNAGAMMNDWITSPDLVSRNSAHASVVQMRLTPRTAELVGVTNDTQLRIHESATSGSAVSSSTKSGFDVNLAVGGGAMVPKTVGGTVGLVGGFSSKNTETSSSGTVAGNKSGIEIKSETGLYKVTADLEIKTTTGQNVVVPTTVYLRLGTFEANAHGLPVNTATGFTAGTPNTRHAPPYLASQVASGGAKVGEFAPGNEVKGKVETAIKGIPGFDGFLPKWNTTADPRQSGRNFADVVDATANQRKLDTELSRAALTAKMDTLLGPGVTVQLKRRGLWSNDYVNVTVKATLRNPTHLGQVEGHAVRGSASVAPRLDASTTVQKGWNAGLEGRVVIPTVTGGNSVSPAPNIGAKYNSSTAYKTSSGATATTTTLSTGGSRAQVFQHDVDITVEVTKFSAHRAWVKRLTPGAPKMKIPAPQVVAMTKADATTPNPASSANGVPVAADAKAIPPINGKVNLWVPDGATFTSPPNANPIGTPTARPMTAPPTIADLVSGKWNSPAPSAAPNTAPNTTAQPQPNTRNKYNLLHVDAVANTGAIHAEALNVLNRAARADGSLTSLGTQARNQIDKMFSAENIKAQLPISSKTGVQEGGMLYSRRISNRTGAFGSNFELSNPKLLSMSDGTPTENALTGGFKTGDSTTKNQSVDLTAAVNVPIKPEKDATAAVGIGPNAKWTPWAKFGGKSHEVGGEVFRNKRSQAQRTYYVQLDAKVNLVAESRTGNVLVKGTPNRAGSTVDLPGSVFVRVDEATARQMGLIPAVPPHTSAVTARMQPPKLFSPAPATNTAPNAVAPVNLGLSHIETVPDLSPLVPELRAELGRLGTELMPPSVLDDSMNNFQRMVDLTSESSVKALVDSALDGGVPLLVHKPGTFGNNSYQVTLRAKVEGPPVFLKATHDGSDMEHAATGSTKDTDLQGKGKSWNTGIRLQGSGLPQTGNSNLSVAVGAVGTGSIGQTHSNSTSTTSTRQAGNLRQAGGPQAHFTVKVKFELVVERGSVEVGRVDTKSAQDMTVRLLADNLKVENANRPAAQPFTKTSVVRPAAEGRPNRIAAWRQDPRAVVVPTTNTSVESFRGAADLRATSVRTMTLAGASDGLTAKGTGSRNALESTLSSETLQSVLLGMTSSPLVVPGQHQKTLGPGQHVKLEIHGRMVNPRLAGLSDTINLENPTSTTSSTASDARHGESGDLTFGIGATNVTSKQSPDLAFTTPGVDTKHGSDAIDTTPAGQTANRGQNPKAGGRSGLVDVDMEYRIVADLGNGNIRVVDLTIPGSAQLRMPAPEVEKLLGNKPLAPLDGAQKRVKDTAAEWRTAEVEVEASLHRADGLDADIAKAAGNLADADADIVTRTGDHAPHATKIDGLDQAVADLDARTAAKRTEVDRLSGELAEAQARGERLTPSYDDRVEMLRDARTISHAFDTRVTDLTAAIDQAKLDGRPTAKLDAALVNATEAQAGAKARVSYARQMLDQAGTEIPTARKNLADAQAELSTLEQSLDKANTDLTDAIAQGKPTRDALDAAIDERARRQAALDTVQSDHAATLVELADRRARSDVKQQAWWDAKTTLDAGIDTFNATPVTPPAGSSTQQNNAPAVGSTSTNTTGNTSIPAITITPPAPPTSTNTSTPRTVTPVHPVGSPDATPRTARPERSFAFAPNDTALSDTQTAQLDELATDLVEANAKRDRLGYLPPVVEVSGAHAQSMRAELLARGIDAVVRPGGRPDGADVHVDWDLKRPEGYVPPVAPKSTPMAQPVVITSTELPSRSVLDDGTWRHSTASTAEWFANPAPVSANDIAHARANTPPTSWVRGEDGGVLNTSTVGPNGIDLRAWRGPIAYDVRTLDIGGAKVKDLTVKIHLDGNTDARADVEARTRAGVDELFNQGHRLPSGEQLHVTVEFVDNPADAHSTVTLTDPDGRANQLNWPVDTDPRRLAHEVGHFIGLQDEYHETSDVKPIFQHQDGKGRVMADNAPMTQGIDATDTSLKPRNAWLIENRMRALESSVEPTVEAAPDHTVQAPHAPTRPQTQAQRHAAAIDWLRGHGGPAGVALANLNLPVGGLDPLLNHADRISLQFAANPHAIDGPAIAAVAWELHHRGMAAAQHRAGDIGRTPPDPRLAATATGNALLSLRLPQRELDALLTDALSIAHAADPVGRVRDDDLAQIALTLHTSDRGTASALARALIGTAAPTTAPRPAPRPAADPIPDSGPARYAAQQDRKRQEFDRQRADAARAANAEHLASVVDDYARPGRSTVLDYTFASDGVEPQFVLHNENVTLDTDPRRFPATIPVVDRGQAATNPPIVFSHDATLGLPQAPPGTRFKEFYATPDLVESANARLREVGSKVTLVVAPGNTVTVDNGSGARSLVMVTPKFDKTPPSVCSEFSQAVIGGTHRQVVMRTDDGTTPVLGSIAPGGSHEFLGTHELADALARHAWSTDAPGDISARSIAEHLERKSIAPPRPGREYGTALRPGTLAHARLNHAAERLGVNQFAWARPGEAYLLQSIAVPDANDPKAPDFGQDFTAHDGAQLGAVWGYHLGSVAVTSMDDATQLTVESVRQGGVRKYALDEAIEANLTAYGRHLPAIRDQVVADVYSTPDQRRLAEDLVRIQSLRDLLRDPAVRGSDRQSAEVELQNAQLRARQMITVLAGPDRLPAPGQMWFLGMYSKAEGESFFDRWAHLDEPLDRHTSANPLVAVTSSHLEKYVAKVTLADDAKRLDPAEVAAGGRQLPEYGNSALTDVAWSTVKAALWRHRNGMPLPEIHVHAYGNSHLHATKTGQARADVAKAWVDVEIARLLEELQKDLPDGERPLTPADITVVTLSHGRAVPPDSTDPGADRRRVVAEMVVPR
ncbi:hypothetical protein GCM10022243_06380 [Saccharothrix violaceirubra]|uniref:Uncharacterized protein n=1 Tax=Saccharothrix violaceirubra TaxID=413306 RepID=A0A7W7WTC6_9PSEU|nr:hypothetical protein [Saccharothrix violaceirubra]MBB4963050.1 hypothetical protein [Saccharothrix violaceirubra]